MRPCRNVAAEPARAFRLADEDQLLLAELARRAPGLILYHSHPDGEAELSEADRAGALIEGASIYPELRLLVVGCRRAGVTGLAVYRWEEQGFTLEQRRAEWP